MGKLDLTGQTFGRLIVLGEDESRSNARFTFWVVQCSCEAHTIKSVAHYSLIDGKTRSCGCQMYKVGQALPVGIGAFNGLYRKYQSRMKNDFTLSQEDFRILTQGVCHYCGTKPAYVYQCKSKRGRSNGVYVYNGIDRIDSTKGYTIENCVSCCGVCNFAKRDMSYADFIAWLDRIVEYRCNNG